MFWTNFNCYYCKFNKVYLDKTLQKWLCLHIFLLPFSLIFHPKSGQSIYIESYICVMEYNTITTFLCLNSASIHNIFTPHAQCERGKLSLCCPYYYVYTIVTMEIAM